MALEQLIVLLMIHINNVLPKAGCSFADNEGEFLGEALCRVEMTVWESLCLTVLSLGMDHHRKHKKDGRLIFLLFCSAR